MSHSNQGNLFIITAPSGAGKTSLVHALLEQDRQVRLSISHTTRAPRPGETNGKEYFFVDEATFLKKLDEQDFLESALVHGARYGTSKSQVNQALSQGFDVILEIDWQGAQQIKKIYPQAISIFILPPSIHELEQRLRRRGQDAEEVIARRVAGAHEEMRHVSEFDYVTI
ncbi:MAG: guanylate kinase, partial [Methylophilaceae bacterium]